MGAYAPISEPADADSEIRRTVELLGGDAVLGHSVETPLEAHELVAAGLPAPALHHLLDSLETIDPRTSVENAVGLSLRTLQRSRANPSRTLSPDQSGRAWQFAAVLALASYVLGSQAAAERWLVEPAIGLDRRRPIDLLSTPTGAQAVTTLLHRIEYGVYT